MNKTPAQAKILAGDIRERLSGFQGCEIVLAVPFTDISAVAGVLEGSGIRTGAQNVHWEASGAFTGEISAAMLLEAGAEYVVIGHSERRQYFGETDETVSLRVRAALAAGLRVILCVGETLKQREDGVTFPLLSMQVKLALRDISAEQMKNVIFAYEPVWAIGTGRTATSAQAQEVCGFLRDEVKTLYGAETAESLIIQYGGSMNASNAAELLSMPDIDGGLIGGASLKAEDFEKIVKATTSIS